MPRTVNGIGTKFYGQRDYHPDGTHITTEWFVVLWIPILPFRSLRVRPVGLDSYEVLKEMGPNWKQVLSVYTYFGFLIGWYFLISFVYKLFDNWWHTDSINISLAVFAFIAPLIVPLYFRHASVSDRRLISPLRLFKGIVGNIRYNRKKFDKFLIVTVKLAATGMLIAAAFRQEHEYYILLRFVVFGVSGFIAIQAIDFKKRNWAWVYVIVALAFNPFLPIHLEPGDWTIVDAVAICLLLVSISMFDRKNPRE